MNPIVRNWLWDDKDAVVSYVGEDESVSVYREGGEVFSADDAIDTLCLHRKRHRTALAYIVQWGDGSGQYTIRYSALSLW